MTAPEKERKIYFSQWGPPTLFCSVFVLGCFIIGAICAALKTGQGSIADLLLHAVIPFGAVLILLVVFLWLVFFRRVCFEENHAVIYYCLFFPVRISYTEINRLVFFYRMYNKQKIPTTVHFYLHSGKVKAWNIDLFSPAVSETIKRELACRVNSSEAGLKIPDIELWTKHVLQSSNVLKIILCTAAVFTFGLGVWEMTEQLIWNEHIKNWDKVEGIILKNTTKRIPQGKRSKEIADVAYKYTYKGRQYDGTRIVYDSDSFPPLKVGSKRQVIVNPDDPAECAVMFWYRGKWGMLRWIKSVFLYLVSLFFAIGFARSFLQKKTTVPERLKNYINAIPPERFHAALNMENPAVVSGNIELRQKMTYLHAERYGVIRKHVSRLSCFIWSILFLLAVLTSVLVPLCWIAVVILGGVVYSLSVPRMTVFDFQEKKIFFCRWFRPEKADRMRSLSFSAVDHLNCQMLLGSISLFAVTHDGEKVPLCSVAPKRLELLFGLLPELAEKMGRLPITY